MVQILDTTLREGEQTPGLYFDNHIKLAIAELLDEIGVDFIEAGHPAVDADIREAVQEIAEKPLRATVCAHSRSLRKDVDQALDIGAKFIGIFYCVSNERLEKVFKRDLDTAITQITDVIRYAKQKNPDVLIRYTPEDTVRSEFQNVVKTAVAAVEAGADIISIADTTGHMIPGTERNMCDYVLRLKKELAAHGVAPKIAVHCHNDRGLAVANALDGYRGGADIIDVSVLGLGERAGFVDMAQLMMTLKQDFNVENNWNLKKIPELYQLVSRHTNTPIPANFPITGSNAFTHCAGVHTHAATQNPLHYQSVDPSLVGREMSVALDHMSGIASVQYALEKIGFPTDKEFAMRVLQRVKDIGKKGRTVDLIELEFIVRSLKRKLGVTIN